MTDDRTLSEKARDTATWVGACLLFVSLVAVVAFNGQTAMPVRPAVTEKSVADARPIGNGVTRLQAAIDATPAFDVVQVTKLDLPATVIPTMKPVTVQKRETVQVVDRRPTASSEAVSEVVRFDRCSPVCETQDPLIVGSTQQTRPSPYLPSLEAGEEHASFSLSPLRGARYLLDRTAAVPGAAIRKGRQVIDRIITADE